MRACVCARGVGGNFNSRSLYRSLFRIFRFLDTLQFEVVEDVRHAKAFVSIVGLFLPLY